MRIVADTNVVVSALLWGGTPRELLAAARAGALVLHTSAALIAELEEILARPKFAERLSRAGSSMEELLADYLALARIVHTPALPQTVARDPDDDHVLACALAAGADAIVSGDDDLLALGTFEGIPLITSAECLGRVREPGA